MEQARNKITESTYRTFKETLCPVCTTFACPFHMPADMQDQEEVQTIKGFAYNPYILEENFKRVEIKPEMLTPEDKQILKDNKIFQNVVQRLKLQKREDHLYRIKCNDNWQDETQGISNLPALTKEDEEDVKRLAIKIPAIQSCQINYLLKIDKCRQIKQYLIKNKDPIADQQKIEVQKTNIFR